MSSRTVTDVRQRGKAAAALLALVSGGVLLSAARGAALVVNPQSGFAISGFDPVAYLTDAKPERGRPDLELSEEGAVWRFCNEGNRAAFAAHPEVYRPVFGGYDAVGITRGRSVPGHPQIWAVARGRLYLFYSRDNRAEFLADSAGVLTRAERVWPVIQRATPR
jgi:hypothetical protein